MQLRAIAIAACTILLVTTCTAQMPAAGPKTSAPKPPMNPNMQMPMAGAPNAPAASPAANAMVALKGKAISIRYGAPSVRDRKIMGGVVPFGQVWRTGANPATTFVTATDLKVGTLTVPAGSYTLYTLPSATTWLLILNKRTGQWGTEYSQSMDLGRTPMKSAILPAPQEVMSITFENTKGGATELHIRWEKTDVSVPVVAQ